MFILVRLGLFVSLELEASVLASSGKIVGGVSFPNALPGFRIGLNGEPSLSEFYVSYMRFKFRSSL
jgi:hypothetical protein